MSSLFIISNSQGHFYSKQKDWTDGKQPHSIYRAKHFDEALNTLLELNAKDIEMRGQVLEAEIDERGEPVVVISDIPLPVTEDIEPQVDAAKQTDGDDGEDNAEQIADQVTA